ncbi:hypothetical protein GSI_08745 [Ganoderma sinense ZZ0214-1]|uniref:Uncharacterized protein n=1 Tax=Ganoderma sinense ZZ0214-1 TaxID=1077348 RepID=A0A2G8S4L6_9APHY|nr:hypothetical protein GSI_08745 [Ganoderma sinense ZZ0214-1]
MRLLDTDTGQFVEKDRDSTHYVVFGDKEEELTLERLRNFQRRYYPLVYQPPQDFSDEGTVSPPLEQDSDGAGSSYQAPHRFVSRPIVLGSRPRRIALAILCLSPNLFNFRSTPNPP